MRRKDYAPHVFSVYAVVMTILGMIDDPAKLRFYGLAIFAGAFLSLMLYLFKE